MNISIKLLDAAATIQQKVNTALAAELNKAVTGNRTKFENKAKFFVRKCIMEQPEIASISIGGQGSLAAQLGVQKGQEESVVNSIVNAIVESTTVKLTRFDNKLHGKLYINFQPSDFVNLLALPQGFVNTEKGQSLHWLRWLLKEGAKPIVIGYQYVPGKAGRSRGGVMMANAQSWRVPPQFSGTDENNFITRAFSGREKEVQDLFGQLLGK